MRILTRQVFEMLIFTLAAIGFSLSAISPGLAQAPAKKPNIVVIMGDDVGMWNLSVYHNGMMGGRTPNMDRIAGKAR